MVNKELLQSIADNPAVLAALRAVIDEVFALDNLSTNMNNDVIGQIVRANIEGRAKVEEAFKLIEQCKSAPPAIPKINRAV